MTTPSAQLSDASSPNESPSTSANSAQSWRIRYAHIALAISMLIMGACGIIYEYTLGVLGNNLMGSSHEQLFVIIGLMLFAMGLGAIAQKRLVERLVDKFLLLELLLGLLGGISTMVIYASFVFTDSYQLIMYAFAMAIGLLIGCEIPLLIRINTHYTRNLSRNLSTILSMDYVGSLIGALLFAYVLLTRVSIERISLILGCANTLVAIGGLAFFWPFVTHRYRLAAVAWLSLMILSLGLWQSSGWMAKLEQRCFEDPIIHSETTKYQHLVLTKSRYKDRTRLYIDGHLQFSSEDEVIYHEMLVHVPMSVAKRHERVLILGGGDGLALREVLRYRDVREVTLVDIDPAIIRLASEHPELIRMNRAAFHDGRVHTRIAAGVDSGESRVIQCRTKRQPFIDQSEYKLATVNIYTVDADMFARGSQGQYDVVLIDFPDPRSIELAKLYSVNFYKALARRLTPNAVVSIQSTNPYRAKQVFRCIGVTLQRAGFRCLPYHDHVPSFGEWGWHLAWRKGATKQTMLELIRGIESLPIATGYLTPEVMAAAFAFGRDSRMSAKSVEPNTNLRPVVVRYYSESMQRGRSISW